MGDVNTGGPVIMGDVNTNGPFIMGDVNTSDCEYKGPSNYG